MNTRSVERVIVVGQNFTRSLDCLLTLSLRYVMVTCLNHGDGVGGRGVRRKDGWSVEQNALEREGLINIEPAICNGHLSYPWGRRWRDGGSVVQIV